MRCVLANMGAKIFIGTSGWVYSHWDGIFYPEGLPSRDKLKFYASKFQTTEINYSFYHLPRPSTFENWYNQAPEGFVFAVKASRFITHIKRLTGVKEAWGKFFENTLHLREKLGPILFQFPPSFKIDMKRLEGFLRSLRATPHRTVRGSVAISSEQLNAGDCFARRASRLARNDTEINYAFEFRHPSWLNNQTFELLNRFNAAWVIADSPRYPKAEVITADFAYIRMHGSKQLFASKYTKAELEDLADKIKKWGKKLSAIYIYFNNDFMGHAVEDATMLRRLIR